MKHISLFLTALLFAGVIAPTASAIPIKFVSATTVPTTYTASTGVLNLDGVRNLDIFYTDGITHTVVPDVRFELTTTLDTDLSDNGIVLGSFLGGSVMLTAGSGGGAVLLSGTVDYLLLMEAGDGTVQMTATGQIVSVSTTGVLSDWAGSAGGIYDLIFEVDPITIASLAEDFSGHGLVTLHPIPEPLTIGLLAIGLAGLAVRRKRH